MSQGGRRSSCSLMEGPWQGVGGDGEVFKSSEWLLIRGGKQREEEEEEGGAICRLRRMLLAVGI